MSVLKAIDSSATEQRKSRKLKPIKYLAKGANKVSLSLATNYVLGFHFHHFCRRNLTNYGTAETHTTFGNPKNMSSVENRTLLRG